MDDTGNRPITPRIFAVVMLLCVLWGGLMVSIKVGLDGVPPILMAALRFGLGAGCIYAWTRIVGMRLSPAPGTQLLLAAPAVILVGQILTMNIGAQYTSASHATVFMQSYPFFVAMIAHYIIPGDRLSLKKILGMILAGAGMVWTMGDGLGDAGAISGDLLVVLSAMFLATQIVVLKHLVRRIEPVALIFWQQLLALPVFILLWLTTEGDLPISFTPTIIVAIVYQGAVIAGFCFVVSTWLLKAHNASQISAFFFTTPLFGVLLSWLILGDQITIHLLGGLLLLAIGLWVINLKMALHVKTMNTHRCWTNWWAN